MKKGTFGRPLVSGFLGNEMIPEEATKCTAFDRLLQSNLMVYPGIV